MSALFQSAHGINSSEAGFIPGAHDFWPDVLLLPLTHAPQDVQPCALLLLAKVTKTSLCQAVLLQHFFYGVVFPECFGGMYQRTAHIEQE